MREELAQETAKGIVIDSRQIEPGYIFVATKGERVDGHQFIPDVFAKGAMAVICEVLPKEDLGPCILVKDSFMALKQAAAELAFKVLRLKNYARMDFMMDEKGDFYCLEANTLPGMTPTSLLPQEAKVLGIEYEDLCQLLIDISMRGE